MTMTKLAQAVAFASVLGVTVVAPVNAGGTGAHAQGTGAQDDTWTSQAAEQYNGRIPRAVYLDEMGRRWNANGNHAVTREQYLDRLGRRWDSLDANGRGLTPAEVSRLSGHVDSNTSGPALSGSGVQPGNMGPGNTKGQ